MVVPTRELCLQICDVLTLILRRYIWLVRGPACLIMHPPCVASHKCFTEACRSCICLHACSVCSLCMLPHTLGNCVLAILLVSAAV